MLRDMRLGPWQTRTNIFPDTRIQLELISGLMVIASSFETVVLGSIPG